MLIDTHCHLDFAEFKHEISTVISRARQRGVVQMINIGTDAESSKSSIDLARRYPEIYATVGLHPESANTLDIETKGYLTALAGHQKVVAIGEIGLDYYYLKRSSKFAHYPSRDQQIFCFEQMLDLALEVNLPVVIHSRESDTDILAILKSFKGMVRGVVHCFSGDYTYAKKILDLGFAISFTGNITFKNNFSIIETIKKIPIGSIMVETDAPLLTPEPYRGKRNEPAYVIEVARKIAEIKGISLTVVELETTKKARKLFRFTE